MGIGPRFSGSSPRTGKSGKSNGSQLLFFVLNNCMTFCALLVDAGMPKLGLISVLDTLANVGPGASIVDLGADVGRAIWGGIFSPLFPLLMAALPFVQDLMDHVMGSTIIVRVFHQIFFLSLPGLKREILEPVSGFCFLEADISVMTERPDASEGMCKLEPF